MLRPANNTTSVSDAAPGKNIKRRLQTVLGIAPYALYYGFVPFVIYLGFKLGPDPNTPEFSILNLLPIG